ncbi:MAG: OmpA family protein [Planctomycetaceae bacterium]|jgi:chemotaxis protein MotB|nr:OmpA family protein [Planctomycetaceae bacterium]
MKLNSTLFLAFLASAPFVTSCAAPQYKAALDEREQENRQLREERANLKGENRDLASQRESLETALAEANARLLEEPTQSSTQLKDLDDAGVGYGMRDGRMVISIPQELTFGAGKADLSDNGKKALKAVAKTLKGKYEGGEYWIEGHTDNDPISKSKFATNRDLSLARAMAVLHYLVNDGGIADGQCVVAGWGPYRPVAANSSSANKAKNRRVEIVVEMKK